MAKFAGNFINLALSLVAILLLLLPGSPSAETNPRIQLDTDLGKIIIELYPDRAPVTVENFLDYVNSYFYDGVIFHRVIENFIIQAGPYTFDLHEKQAKQPIRNESKNGLKNLRGSIAMARSGDPDSARVHFYINLRDNQHLDAKANKPGYTVFGKVLEGMDVVDSISRVPTYNRSGFPDLPVEPVRILKASRLEP